MASRRLARPTWARLAGSVEYRSCSFLTPRPGVAVTRPFADLDQSTGQVDELSVAPPGPDGHGHDPAGPQYLRRTAEEGT
ncbi:MAG: hypothetical protein ACRDZ6_03045, partial [Acidimicrobiales bacterium]